jgi:Domain of unknown function (DUF397)
MPINDSGDRSLSWRTASYSVSNGACVEVASAPGRVSLRDSKDPEGPVLNYSADAFRSFLDATKRNNSSR